MAYNALVNSFSKHLNKSYKTVFKISQNAQNLWFKVQGLGFGAQGLEFRVLGLGQGLGFSGLGFRFLVLGFNVYENLVNDFNIR